MVNVPLVCRLFGVDVLTHVAPPWVCRGTGPVALEIVPFDSGGPDAVPSGPPALSVQMWHPDGEGPYEVWPSGEAIVLRVNPVAVFRCSPGRIEYRCLDGVPDGALPWQAFGLVMSVWSELIGRPVLHGATVQVAGAAVAFLGSSGAGKSSLTMEFVKQGHAAFGDDQLVLDARPDAVYVMPAVPWLKIGPAIASYGGLDPAALPRFHSDFEKRRLDLTEGQWAQAPSHLGPIYLLERGWARPEVVIEPMGPAESLMALLHQSYVPRTVVATGLAARRMPLLVRAATQAGVWRLKYPDGVEWLPEVRAAIVRHQAERLSGSPAQSPR